MISKASISVTKYNQINAVIALMKNPAITHRQPLLLTNPVFVTSLLLLIFNDFIFKPAFHNWITGKLSDFAGILVLALLLAYVFPKLLSKAAVLSAAVFVLWKSPLATPLIYLANATFAIPLHRTIDYTDLFALAVVPFTWVLIERLMAQSNFFTWPVWSRDLLVLAGALACTATAMSPKQRAGYDGTIEVYQNYALNVSKSTALNRLKSLGYDVKRDTINGPTDSTSYLVSQIVLDQQDTLKSIRFKLQDQGTKSKLRLETVQATHPLAMKDYHAARKRYEALVKAGIVAKLEN